MNLARLLLSTLLAAAVVATPAFAQDLAGFRLVSEREPERLERRLRQAGNDGYRVLGTARGVGVDGNMRISALLQRDAAGDGPYDYRVLATSGNLNDEAEYRKLNDLGADGFRIRAGGVLVRSVSDVWLPDDEYEDQMILVLERGARPVGVRYESERYGVPEKFERALKQRRVDGFEILGLWVTQRRLQAILEAPLDAPASSSTFKGEDYRMMILPTRKYLKIKLNNMAGQGYRVLTTEDPPTTGPPLMLLERNNEGTDKIEYRFFDEIPKKLHRDVLEQKLNKKAAKGWTVTLGGVTDNVVTLEHIPGSETRVTYRAVSSSQKPGLSPVLEEATAAGYEYVAMFVKPAETMVLLEKVVSD
ncbi:MAG: hypothetical protein GY716_17735 [bacterium]|nr:hypothetical protein [bacterium]